jgi:hypothetical protein
MTYHSTWKHSNPAGGTVNQKLAFLTLVLLLPAAGCRPQPLKPKPPSGFELSLRETVVLTRAPDSTIYVGDVPASVLYRTPVSGTDCQTVVTKTHVWEMDGPDDMIDVTLNDQIGVQPGLGNSRSYELTRETQPNSQSWSLIMKQGTPATDALHVMTWRLQPDAKEGLNAEVGDGGPWAPPPGTPPFGRNFNRGNAGGKYVLRVVNSAAAPNLTISLNIRITNGGLVVCK